VRWVCLWITRRIGVILTTARKLFGVTRLVHLLFLRLARALKFTQVDSHFCKIKRRCSFLYNFAQSVLENSTILFFLAERYDSGSRQGVQYTVLRIDLALKADSGLRYGDDRQNHILVRFSDPRGGSDRASERRARGAGKLNWNITL
jgi:hypothetical protein